MSRVEPWLHSPKATAEIINKYAFRFKKSFGQNFLIDSNVIKKIISAADIKADDFILEIGPGIGTLTQHLAFSAGNVAAVEIDDRLIPVLDETLAGYDNVTVINEDVLNVDLEKLVSERSPGKRIKVIANLPYYVTTPVIMELLKISGLIRSITIMVQKEVADRMAADPGTKDYGALSLAVEYYCGVKKITDVSPNCFMPRPEVTSSVIQLNIRDEKQPVKDERLMFKLIKAAFAQRRKTLLNSLRNSGEFNLTKEQWEEALEKLGIEPSVRGEKLKLEDFVKLADEIMNFL